MTLTLTDLFCGAGGSSTGAVQVEGVEVRIASNHWDLAVETHNTNHPGADHLCADLSQIDPRYFPTTDILWASPECFTAGHLVTTLYRGQVPIEDVVVGDLVLTHTGRFMPVTRVQSRTADTVLVRGQGHPGIETTANHSFWARESGRVWQNDIRRYRREYADAEWIRADELLDKEALWATPTEWDRRDAPFRPLPSIFGTNEAAYLLGRWLGDGSASEGKNTDITISCSFSEDEYLGALLTPLGWHRDVKRTAVNYRVGDKDARDWLIREFGHGADGKQLPTWVLFWPEELRLSALRGYLDADGGESQRRVRASTVSRKLAVSIRLLAESLGHRVAMAYDKRETYSIEGRTGVAKRQWIMHWEPQLANGRSPEAFVDGIHAWSRVRSVEPANTGVTVYNIEVAEDHSYVLDGIVVKNCTNHSMAKGRKRVGAQPDLFGEALPDAASERSRATMWDVPRFAEVHQYQAVIVENVVDAWHWVPFRAWLMAMDSLGYDHHIVMLNSMHAHGFGVGAPQSRDRMYVVFWRKGNPRPDLARINRPEAICGECGPVRAMQSFKKPDSSWGRYRAQYVYRCPNVKCRNQIVEPFYRPAADIIDWTLEGVRIGDRTKPLAAKTMARIQAGIDRYWGPVILEAAGNTYDSADPKHPQHGQPGAYMRAWPTDDPLRTVHTSMSKALAVPVEGRIGKQAVPMDHPLRTMTTRNETGMAFIAELRGGGSKHRPVTDPLATVTASGNHHGLVTTYYGNGSTVPTDAALPTCTTVEHHALLMRNNTARGDQGQMTTPVSEAARTMTTKGHQSLLSAARPTVDINDVRFRMLEPREIIAAMDFPGEYVVLGNRREQVRMAGNAVTPCAARDLVGVVAESLAVAS